MNVVHCSKARFAFVLFAMGCSTLSCTAMDASQANQRQSLFGNRAGAPERRENVENQRRTQGNSVPPYPGQMGTAEQGNPPGYELRKVDGNIWRTGLEPPGVYQMVAKLVSQNYVIAAADRRNFTLSTDWDKFFIEGRLFRNRLSVSVFPVGIRRTDVVIRNVVEYFDGRTNRTDEDIATGSWLPSPDLTDEVPRIIDHLNRQIALLYQSRGAVR